MTGAEVTLSQNAFAAKAQRHPLPLLLVPWGVDGEKSGVVGAAAT